jgi:hypothetical protein
VSLVKEIVLSRMSDGNRGIVDTEDQLLIKESLGKEGGRKTFVGLEHAPPSKVELF